MRKKLDELSKNVSDQEGLSGRLDKLGCNNEGDDKARIQEAIEVNNKKIEGFRWQLKGMEELIKGYNQFNRELSDIMCCLANFPLMIQETLSAIPTVLSEKTNNG